MPGKRSKHMFSVSTVPVSVGWRLGSPKHYLFYLGASEIKKMLVCRARVQSYWPPKVPNWLLDRRILLWRPWQDYESH